MQPNSPPAPRKERNLFKNRFSYIAVNKQEAVVGFRWSLLYSFVNKFILPLVNNAIVVRILGPAIIGTFSLTYSIFACIDMVRDFGLSLTHMREREMTPEKEGVYMALAVIQGLVPAVLLFFGRGVIAKLFHAPELAPMLMWVSLGLGVNAFWTIPNAKVMRLGRVKESGFREAVANVAQVALSVVLVLNGYTYFGLVFPLFINCVLNTLITYGIAPVTNLAWNFRAMLKLVRDCASTLGTSVLTNFYLEADKFVIARFAGTTPQMGLTAVGLYGQAQGLALKPMQLLSVPMMAPLQSAFSQNSGDPQKIGMVLRRALASALMFVIPLYGIAMIGAYPVTLLILGGKWVAAVPLIRVCCVFFAARSLGMITGSALVAGGSPRIAMLSWIPCYLAAALACIPAAMHHSVMGFAWAFSLGVLVVHGIQIYYSLRLFPSEHQAAKLLRSSCWIAVLSCLFLAFIAFLPLHPWLALGLACVVWPIIHLAIIGSYLAGRPAEYMSVSGVRSLLHSL